MAVVKKFGDDQGGSLAALVAYYAFFSIFPILLVFTTILGFVLQGDSTTRQSVVDTITKQIPVVGSQLHVNDLKGSVPAIVIGLVTSLLAGLGVTNAAQNAFDRVWAVPFKERPDFLKARLRGLGLLVLARPVVHRWPPGASALVAQGLHGLWAKAGGIVLSLVINCGLFLAAFRFLTAAEVSTRCLWVGVVRGGGALGDPPDRRRRLHRPRAQERARATTPSSPPSSRCSCSCTSAPSSPSTRPRSTSWSRASCGRAACSGRRRSRRRGDPDRAGQGRGAPRRRARRRGVRAPPRLRTADRPARAGSSQPATSTARPGPGSRRTPLAQARR